MKERVVFSKRAYTAILAETLENISTETGGVFLGHYQDGTWYVIETTDPGPKADFSSVILEMDFDYINHLVNKLNKLYSKPLRFLGIWHRHPGSMDTFSSTDNGTNDKYAEKNQYGAISALVNIDPNFRLTVYSVKSSLLGPVNTRIDYRVDDSGIPEELRRLLSVDEFMKRINSRNRGQLEPREPPPADFLKHILKKVKHEHPTKSVSKQTVMPTVPTDDLDRILETLGEDIDYLGEIYPGCIMSTTKEGALRLCDKTVKKPVAVDIFSMNGKIYGLYRNKWFEYRSGMFKAYGEKERRKG
jgi:proteasome lid subunit RPN8/RPN11